MAAAGESPLLIVYVVWHPGFTDGEAYAELLFKQLCADPEHPATRGLGIPVRFRTGAAEDTPPPVDFTDALHTVVVVLVDDELVAAPGWDVYVEELMQRQRPGDVDRVIPVALSANALNLPGGVTANQFVRLQDRPPELVPLVLASEVMHDVCRVLSDQKEKIQVFISHTKEDGVQIARIVQRYLHENTGLADFFDATDIEHGTPFVEEIEEGLGKSAVLLAVQTDSYASREWCRREVLEAKRMGLPILVVAAVQNGEVRSFPYIGNVPVLRWDNESSMERIVHALLREALRREWFPAHMRELCARVSILPVDSFTYPPELLTALLLRADMDRAQITQYLYPDPPLGTEELRLLAALDPNLVPITPTELLA